MSDMNAEKIQSLCAKYGIHPSKARGQNFVIDANVIRMVIEHANLDANDYVLEIGPGFGALTQELVKRVKKVVAVELDKRMCEAAADILARYKNLELVQEDILKFSNERLVELLQTPSNSPSERGRKETISPPYGGGVRGGVYKLVANLPYSITSAVLRKFTEYEPKPTLMVVMVQKEVAERVCAEPGAMSILSVAVQYYGKPEIVALVPRSAFWPEPEVDSAILKIEVTVGYPAPEQARYGAGKKLQEVTRSYPIDEKRLFQLVRIGFSSRRKQLQNNLSAGLKIPREKATEALLKASLDPKVRAQELAVENWIALAQFL